MALRLLDLFETVNLVRSNISATNAWLHLVRTRWHVPAKVAEPCPMFRLWTIRVRCGNI
jgi:hypothetical protein